MKKSTSFKLLVALVTLLLSTISLSAQENKKTSIKWINIIEVEKTLKQEGNSSKRVFIDCFTDWCGWCKKMDKDTFEDTLISKIMNYYFVSVKFDAEDKRDISFAGTIYKNPNPNGRRTPNELAAKLLNNRLSYPSFSVLNSDLTIATVIPGYYSAKDFEPMAVFLGGKYETKYSWEEFRKIYESEIKPQVLKLMK